eukprot:7173752-Prymnesium_polylepis.1
MRRPAVPHRDAQGCHARPGGRRRDARGQPRADQGLEREVCGARAIRPDGCTSRREATSRSAEHTRTPTALPTAPPCLSSAVRSQVAMCSDTSLKSMPEPMRAVCGAMQQACGRRELGEVATTALTGGYLMLRFFNPSLVTPASDVQQSLGRDVRARRSAGTPTAAAARGRRRRATPI